jgi:inosine-uridine nucleoside N-ribohydrolase
LALDDRQVTEHSMSMLNGHSEETHMGPRARVISDNDYAGDPDGLVQLAQALLSPSTDVRAVIASLVPEAEQFAAAMAGATTTAGREAAATVTALAGSSVPVLEGSPTPLVDRSTPNHSPGAEAIVEEAMRDSDLPLYLTLGASLSELASAYLIEPRIAERLTAVWIGGPEYPELTAPPPGAGDREVSEYNLRGDITAAQVVFDSPIPLWQVPRNGYRQALVTFPELEIRMRPQGALGAHLFDTLAATSTMLLEHGIVPGETFVLGDSPVVLLTALQSLFEADASSSFSVTLPRPAIADDGTYVPRADGHPVRVYTQLDSRLMFEDLYAKLALHASRG